MTAIATLIAVALLGFLWIRRSRPVTTAGSVRTSKADSSTNAACH